MIWQSPKNWYQTRPESSHCHGDPRYIYVHIIMLVCYQRMESQRIKFLLEEDLLNVGTLHRCHKKLN